MSLGIDIETLSETDDIRAAIRKIYGEVFLGTGLIHVTSVWRRDPQTHLTIRIGPDAPPSSIDQFALNLARARADAIITTGRILRQEPNLTHELQGPGSLAQGLAAWRAEELSKLKPPISLVLSSGRDLDLAHPLFQSPGRTLVLTDQKGAWNLESRTLNAGVEIIAMDETSPSAAVDLLRSEFGCATISVEAGPSVARQYYEPPVAVDELMLSIYCGEPLPPGARGMRQVPPQRLETLFRKPTVPFLVPGADGEPEWEFHRYVRP